MTNGSSLRPHHGAMVLVLGIVGLVCCMPAGVVAWVLGASDLKAMQAGTMDRSGESTTRAGMIIGIIATVWGVIVIVGWVILLALGMLPAFMQR